jgi:hypothetical protein
MAAWDKDAPALLPRKIDESLADARARANAMTVEQAKQELQTNPVLAQPDTKVDTTAQAVTAQEARPVHRLRTELAVGGAAILTAVGLAYPLGGVAKRTAELMFPPQKTQTHLVRTTNPANGPTDFGYRTVTTTTPNIP